MESGPSRLSVGGITSRLGVFKEPRGIIRIFQFIFAIFAFATACNGRSSTGINVSDQNNAIVASWSYPYQLQGSSIISSGIAVNTISNANDPKSPAEFFLFTGITSMILALACIVLYILMEEQYRNNEMLPIVDFTITIIWTIFWIAGSSAWAQGVTNIRSLTAWDNIAQRSGVCIGTSICSQSFSGTYANIIVSVIFGYLNFVLWAGSVWFVFKETRFFKARTVQETQQQVPPQMPPNTFSNIGSPSMGQQSQNRPGNSMNTF